jgi:beta-N-acetylhexosaminidase
MVGRSVDAGATNERAARAERLGDAQLVGQRLVAGFGGTQVPSSIRHRIREGRLAGVILFADNLPSRDAGRALIDDLQSIPRPRGLRLPLLVMVDQEGGQVKRLAGPPCCSAREMGDRGSRFSRREGAATADSLGGVGINVDLAPVLDVARPGSAIGAQHRSFGRTRERVAHAAGAFADGLRRHGIVPTAKHFPGLGAAPEDTDFAVQRIGLSKTKLRRRDEYPYGRFAESGGAHRMVMLSTAIYPSFSDNPAALARTLATRELRERLGFRGVSISDALDTVSALAWGSTRELARQTAKAGTDLLLFTNPADTAKAADALHDALDAGHISRRNLLTSAQRVLDLRESLKPRH